MRKCEKMKQKRLIDEKYWSQFININPITGQTIHDGHKFEDLIKQLLDLMYHGVEWTPTQMTHDGNKDFIAQNGEDVYWAECKNYKTKIDIKTLAATLIMAEIENVNTIFFFCYSEINNNTKTKLNSYSKSNQKSIFFFDGIVLDQLIWKYKADIFPQFFPDLQNHIDSIDITDIISEPIALCYLERNPFFNGTPEFDMQNLTELQELKLGEIIGIHIIIINTNLNDHISFSIELTFPESNKYFQMLEDEKNNNHNIKVSAGSTERKTFYLKLHSWAPKVSLPKIVCKTGGKIIGTFSFPLINTLRTRQTAFLGSHYVEKVNYICRGCLNQKKLSVIYLYGASGTGKSRMIAECMAKFVGSGYYIIRLSNMGHGKYSTFTMLKELIFSLYGFSDEIIEHIIQNSYDMLENYNNDSYKKVFEILKVLYNNYTSNSKIENLEYSVFFEKMAKEKYFIMIDDIQYWDDYAVSFLKHFYQYALSMQRKCNTIIGIVANTDVLYNQNTKEFLMELLSKNDSYNDNFYSYKLPGFETFNQTQLFLKEILGLDDDFDELEPLIKFSIKPKYLTEVANYLLDIHAINIVNNKAVVDDKPFLQKALVEMPETIQIILEKRWSLFLKHAVKEKDYYKKIISSILLLEKVKLLNDAFGMCHKDDIDTLFQYGFLKKEDEKNNIYVFEHDSIKFYFKKYYKDWFETAVFYLDNPEHNFLAGHRLEYICDLYKSNKFTEKDFYNYMDDDYSFEIQDKMNEKMLCYILQNGVDDTFALVRKILYTAREQYGEKRAESFYEIFEKQYDKKKTKLTFEEYCTIILDYAENQLKLKSTEKAVKLYDLILKKLIQNPFSGSEYLVAKIENRYFVCGRVGSSINQYSEKWKHSLTVARKKKYCDLCIENYFDKAHSLFLDNNSFKKAASYLKKGCNIYLKHQPQRLKGQYLYRDVQRSFLKKEYKQLKNKIWKYDEEISGDNTIEFKLYFRIQFLIFKITFCLLGEKEYSDFEMENMLESLNMLQTMQNELQLYRYLYLYGKYCTKKSNWEKAYIIYQKVFENLAKNKNTEEIRLQRMFIAQDMIIGFKQQQFPFEEYDMSFFDAILKGSPCEKVRSLSNKGFSDFLSSYIPLAPITNDHTKEGFLLF